MIRVLILAASAVGVAACGQTLDAVYLRHAETGDEVACGPITGNTFYAELVEEHGTQTPPRWAACCIEDFKQQGYVRIDKPSS